MRVLASRVGLLVLIAPLAACAARAPRSASASGSAASAGGDQATAGSAHPGDTPREMTWEEYYVDVEQRAKRAGGFVMWFNPPRPVRRPAQAPGPDPTVNGPLSSPAR